jgi:protein transport protein SEC24
MNVLPVWELKDLIYPRFYSIHDLADGVGSRDDANRLPMPGLKQLSAENVDRTGLYLIKSALDIYLWVGKSADPQRIADLFGVASYENVPDGPVRTECVVKWRLFLSHICIIVFLEKATLPRLDTDLSQRVRNIITGLRMLHPRYLVLHVIKEDSKFRGDFLRLLVDDRQDDTFSYYEFLTYLRSQTNKA